MMTVYVFSGAYGLASLSPFCLKLIRAFEWLELDYDVRPGDPRRAPHGKLPYVTWDGEVLADSAWILREVARRTGKDLDAHLSEAARARVLAATRVLEDSLYWALVADRWDDDAGWQVWRGVVAAPLPSVLRPILPGVIRRKVRRQLEAQGETRRPEPLRALRVEEDLDAVLGLLGDAAYLGGDRPSSADASAYGLLANAVGVPVPSRLARAVSARPRALAWLERLEAHAASPSAS